MGLLTPRSPKWFDGRGGLWFDIAMILGSVGMTIAGGILLNQPVEDEDLDDLEYQIWNVDVPILAIGVVLLLVSIVGYIIRHRRAKYLQKMGFAVEANAVGATHFDPESAKQTLDDPSANPSSTAVYQAIPTLDSSCITAPLPPRSSPQVKQEYAAARPLPAVPPANSYQEAPPIVQIGSRYFAIISTPQGPVAQPLDTAVAW